MGYDDRRPRKFQQRVLEDLLGLDIQMVGRFVENQRIGAAEHQLEQRESCFLAAGQAADPQEYLISAKQEATQNRAHFRIRI